jgi:hypothetical protein
MPSNTGGTKKELRHEDAKSTRDELRAALHVHTLAQILYAHVVTARPWTLPPNENAFGYGIPGAVSAPSWEAAPPAFTPGAQSFWPH